jgi:hypothetical protein
MEITEAAMNRNSIASPPSPRRLHRSVLGLATWSVFVACAPEPIRGGEAEPVISRSDDILHTRVPGPPAPEGAGRALGSLHPGHFANKRPLRTTAPRVRPSGETVLADETPASAALAAKQAAYLEKWRQLEPSLAHLTPEEREARQDELKRSVLGN